MQKELVAKNIILTPSCGKYNAIVIFSHGLGDSASGICPIVESIALSIPYAKFYLPSASDRSVTLNNGVRMPAWYDIKSIGDPSCDGIESSVPVIENILREEHVLGLPYSRMVLAGFSQGGALSLYIGLQLASIHLAGILVFSGYLPGYDKFKITPGLEDVRILHCHGLSDPLLPASLAELSKSLVQSKGSQNYELKLYPGVGHTIDVQEIDDAIVFLKKVIPPSFLTKIPEEMTVQELREAISYFNLTKSARGLTEKSEFINLVKCHLETK